MTLVMVAMNQHFAIQVSDRRLTTTTAIVDDEYAKSIFLQTPSSRMMVAFTGIATTANRSFSAHKWIQKTLADVSYACQSDHELISRFAASADQFFQNSPALAGVSPEQKKLEVCFSGYRYINRKSPGVFATVSNLQSDSGHFSADFHSGDTKFQFLTMIGARHKVKDATLFQVQKLLRRLEKHEAMVNLLGGYVRGVAEAGGTLSTIGKSLDWIALYSDPLKVPISGYMSGDLKSETYMSDTLVVGSNGPIASVGNIVLQASHPLAVPKVHRNAPCPCGSGKRYRDCHRD